MLDRDPTSYDLLTYTWVLALSIWSGIVSYHNKIKQGTVKVLNWMELLGDLLASTLVGVLTFWLCELAEIQKLQAAILISIAAHTGSRALFMYEKYWELKTKIIANKLGQLDSISQALDKEIEDNEQKKSKSSKEIRND